MSKYYEYIHNDSSITTIDELLSPPLPLVGNMNKIQLLSCKGDTETTNLDRIWLSYSEEERNDELNIFNYGAYNLSEIKLGTLLLIPKDRLNNELANIIGSGVFRKNQSEKAFISEELKKIQNDPNYTRRSTIRTRDGGGGDEKGYGGNWTIQYMTSFCQVWVYVRSINKVIDITRFISSINTSVSQIGSFSMNLSPTQNIYKNLKTDSNWINLTDVQRNNIFHESWFVRHLQKNDIFFIKFEKLNLDKNRVVSDDFEINNSEIPNQVYDMIGLMDNVSCSYNAFLNELSVNVDGRDLNKLLIEDGSFFYPYAFIEGAEERFFINTDNDNRYFRRLFVDGEFKSLFSHSHRSIRHSLGFIFNQLSNVGILTDNDLFASYGNKDPKLDRRSKIYLTDDNGGGEFIEKNGIHQIIELISDPELDDRRIADSSISNPDGTLMDQINKLCQQPFVEFQGDTYGDKFVFTARQPPFTGKQINDYIDNNIVIEIDPVNVASFNFTFHDEYYTWYQLKPEGSFLGKSDYIFLAAFPAILIPQYMQVFGNNRMAISSNYISYKALSGLGADSNINLFREAAVNDLIYMIESTIYLPFARKGTIVIKGGDRRIKKGMWIYFKSTNEYFYVNSVNNMIRIGSSDIDRETTISVERGLKKPYLKPNTVNIKNWEKEIKNIEKTVKKDKSKNAVSFEFGDNYGDMGKSERPTKYTDGYRDRFDKDSFEVSYFNILKTDYVKDKLVNFSSGSQNTGRLESVIRDDVMNFFMLKMQFDD